MTKLPFYNQLTPAQKKTTEKFYNRHDSRNFEINVEDGAVTGIYGPYYDKSYFVIDKDGTYIVYSK